MTNGGCLWLVLGGAIVGFLIFSAAKNYEPPAANFPSAPTNYVTDSANVINETIEAQMNEDLKAFDAKAQIAVVTVETTEPETIEQYTIDLAEKWGPGYKDKDNGIIFLVAVKDRKMRIEVSRGLEGDLTDSEAGRIIDSVKPAFRESKYAEGIKTGIEGIKKEVQ